MTQSTMSDYFTQKVINKKKEINLKKKKIDFENTSTSSNIKTMNNQKIEMENDLKMEGITMTDHQQGTINKMTENFELNKVDLKNPKKPTYIQMTSYKTSKIETDVATSGGAPAMTKNKKKIKLIKKQSNGGATQTCELKKIDLKINEKDKVDMSQTTQTSSIKQKIDLKKSKKSINTTQTKMLPENIKTTIYFNNKFYYSKYGKKYAKKNKLPYTSPAHYCRETEWEEGKYLVKYDRKGPNGITYIAYGVLSYEDIKQYSWGVNNNLFEVIHEEQPRKWYCDIDDRYIDDEHNSKIMYLIHKLFTRALGLVDCVNDEINACVCYGKGFNEKKQYNKMSFHMILQDYYFRNHADMKKMMNYLHNIIYTEDEFEILRNDVFDFNPYTKLQAFKLPYQTKIGGTIIQQPLMDGETIDNYLITKINDGMIAVDVSAIEEFDDTKKKQLKTASGKSITCNFSDAMVIDALKSAMPEGYKINIGGMKGNSIEYYLKSIPNHKDMPKLVWKVVGYCIRNIVKDDIERGLKLWTDWTKQYDPNITIEDLRDEYVAHSSTKGYGWKMLFNLGAIFNPKMTKSAHAHFPELFNDEPEFDCEKIVVNQKYIDKQFFKDTLKTKDTIFVKAPMGSGKSFTLKSVFEERDEDFDYKYPTILYLSCKRAFACAMASDFSEYDFENYMDVGGHIDEYDRIICSCESINRARLNYDLVIIDESESIADNITGAMFLKKDTIQKANHLYHMIREAPKVIVMDAYITSRSFKMINEIRGFRMTETNTLYYRNEFMNEKRYYIDCDKGMLLENITKKLKEGKRCVVVCGSFGLAEKIKQDNADYETLHYSSKNPLPLKADVNKLWSTCKLLIYTPTITAGISYDPKTIGGMKDTAKHFDNLFVYCVNVGSNHFRDTIQAHRRVRDFTSNKIYWCINDNYRGHNYEMLPTRFDEVIELEEKYKSKLFDTNVKSLKDTESLAWIYNIHIHNILERNVSQIYTRKIGEEYLKQENIIKIKGEHNGDKIELEATEWDFDKIRSISSQQYSDYQNQIEQHENLDEEEFTEWFKFKYSHILTNNTDEAMKEYFNKFCPNAMRRGFIHNITEYRKMLEEIEYDYNKIKQHKSIKFMDETMPKEYYDIKYLRYEHLVKIMDAVGLIKDKKLNINAGFLGKDFDKLIDYYSQYSIKTLNGMLKNNYITTKKKSDTAPVKSRTIQGIFNQLLREEFGVELKNDGVKYGKGPDGKRKKWTKFKLVNHIEEKELKLNAKYYNPEYLIMNIIKEKVDYENIPYIPTTEGEDIVSHLLESDDDSDDSEEGLNYYDEEEYMDELDYVETGCY